MEKVRAKFQVQQVTKNISALTSVILTPVTTGCDENKEFWKYTPSGKLEMTISNPDAAGFFEPGEEIYLDFSKAK